MLTLTRSACIDAPVTEVWAVLSELEAIPRWVPSIRKATCPGSHRGPGAVRVCELDRATVRETVTAWSEGRSFSYRGEGAPLMKRATNTWSVEARGGQTLVTSVAEVELQGGVWGRLLEPLVRVLAGRLGERSLASLKYLVEHGEPAPAGARLAPAPAGC